MKKIAIIILLAVVIVLPLPKAAAQIPGVSIITKVISKVIRAIDLKIQQEQNKVIWLQNAQKSLENTMSQLKLNDISQWADKQRKLYDDYFQELKKVKTALSTYTEVKNIIQRQKELITEYNTTWGLLRQDRHFTQQELSTMSGIYSNIIGGSLKSLEQLELAVTSFSTQMTDGKRLELIHSAGKNLDQNVNDMRSFNNSNVQLSLFRARDEKDAASIKSMYGIQ